MTHRWMIDFDDVLADRAEAFVRGCNTKFGSSITLEEETTWDWWRQQPKEYADYVWKDLYLDDEWFLRDVQPCPGAINALTDLLTNLDGIAEEVKIITARTNDRLSVAVEWVAQHLPDGLWAHVVSTESENGEELSKAFLCKYYNLNIIVDDNADNLRQMNAYRQQLFLVDKPWNRHELLTRVERVTGLSEVVDRVATQVAA